MKGETKNVKTVEEKSKSISLSVKETLTGLREVTGTSQIDESYLIADKLASRQSIDVALAHDRGPGKIAHLLRKLARESDQFCEIQKKEEQKIENYRKISARLTNISVSADDVVASQLARSMVTRRDCQSLIEKNDEDCTIIWEEMINILSEETKRAIDQHLHLALTNEMMRGITTIGEVSKKRKRVDTEDFVDPQPRDDNDTRIAHVIEESPSVNNGAFQINRRQGTGTPSLSITQQEQKQDPEDNELEQCSTIEQLRLKVKSQEEKIAFLTEENKTVGPDSEISDARSQKFDFSLTTVAS
ncbi:hypothetical protein JR316_0003803 [Psilocybe cubensis]|uniref:Uncharacterized protein n=1 Tax=Psilocybe cubensis TaxID=181762 RepID=A0ACB8H9J4_PSICU|nr:hypothetical protein JR316_0003803 [Psilocybe cubensis]KAH9484322.1 hypothetical protein JR316_0003803 [Psilocybe cubensis]